MYPQNTCLESDQWYYNIPSSKMLEKVPLDFLKKAYFCLHDLELDLAVQKVGEVS